MGIGIPIKKSPHIFDRLYQADTCQANTVGKGLGFSITQWIFDQHHCTVMYKALRMLVEE